MKITNEIAIPYVGGIIERTNKEGQVELLLQTRWKPDRDPIYSGTLEFPAGVLDIQYENVYKTLEREIKEETGLNLLKIVNDDKTEIYSPKGDDASFAFKPFCCTQQIKSGKPWIGFIFLCEVENSEPKPQKKEVKDIRWVNISELRQIFENNPEKLFTLEIAAWEYYFAYKSS